MAPTEPDAAYIEAVRRMTPAQKLEVAAELWFTAKSLKAIGVRKLHPEWSEDEVKEEVRKIFLYAAS